MHDMVNIYELLNRIIVNKRYSLSPNLFIEADRTELSEEERSIFDLLKNIVSLRTKIHNDGIEFHPMFVMADDSRTFSIEDISEDDYLILHSLKLEKMPLILRALIADILWTNKKEFSAAKIAANAYWELFTLWYRDDDNVGTIDIIRRAVCISAQTKQTLLFEKIQGWFVDFLEKKAANNDVKWGIYLYPEDFVNGKTLADGFYFVSKTQGIERTLQNGDALHQISAKVGTRTDITVTRWNAYFEEPEDPSEVIHDGYAVFVMDNTGWDALTLYAWGNDLPELFGGWPGISPTGSVEIKGITYKYFDTGEANKGLVYNLIFNDNGVGSQFDGPQNFTLDRDIYLEITESGWTEIDPDAVVIHDGYAIFIEDQSGWAETTIYAWGNDIPELFGCWPGILPTGSVEIKGVTYNYYDTGEANKGLTYNLIMNNNNGGSQFDLAAVTLDRDYYFRITDIAGEEIDPNNPDGDSEPESEAAFVSNQNNFLK